MELKVTNYVNQYYKGVRFGASSDGRKGYSARDLLGADRKAVSAALKDLKQYDYKAEKEDDDKTLAQKVQAFIETYNNYMDSADAMDNNTVSSYKSKIKKLTKEQSDLLEKIGVTVQNNGKLKVDKEKLEKASNYKVSKVFGEDTKFPSDLDQIMKRLENSVRKNGLGIPVQTSSATSNAASTSTASAGTSADGQDPDSQLYQALSDSLNNGSVNYSI